MASSASATAMIEWFDGAGATVFNGDDYAINTTGSYYCQVTDERGVYRSNTFTVYRTGELLLLSWSSQQCSTLSL